MKHFHEKHRRLMNFVHTERLLFVFVSLALCSSNAHNLTAEDRLDLKILKTVVGKHCADCHGADDYVEGDVNLVELIEKGSRGDVDLLQKIIHVIDRNEMPPEGEPELKVELRRSLLTELQSTFRQALAEQRAEHRTPIRRMNRFQYNNAVTDLFELKCIVFTLPERLMRDHDGYFQPQTGKMPDVVHVGNRPLGKSQMIEPRLAGVAAFPQDLRAEHGYDNQADHLSLSPLLMESFLKLGQSITESPDFTPKNVGIWKQFFASPASEFDFTKEVQSRLRPFLTRAFRRPVEEQTLDRYTKYVTGQIQRGTEFSQAMKMVAAAVISSPRFLYLYDSQTTNDTKASDNVQDGFALASRLSFFLWGSLPDDELLQLAASGKLRDRDVLIEQTERMLKDQKLKRFCDSFPAQWLQLDRLISSVPDRQRFPGFYFAKYRNSMHMMLEPLLVFETVLIENQPLTQLIDSDFTYRSSLLQEAYGDLQISTDQQLKGSGGNVTKLSFYRLPVNDRRNGGVITNAAVMTMTSGPERTQPITRGAWVASVIFNNPPKPPPADVPPLEENPGHDEEKLTLRERLAIHRQRADCKGCHEKIDPLGFALENYDPIGVWRDKYLNGRDVDVSGQLFRTHEFTDVVGFKDSVLAEKERFTRAFAGHLLSFALARELTAADQIAVEKIASATEKDEDRIQTMIKSVILSEPFCNQSNVGLAPDELRESQ